MRSKLSFVFKASIVFLFSLVWAKLGAQTFVVNNLLPADQQVCAPLSLGASSVVAPPIASLNTLLPGFVPQVMSFSPSSIPFVPGIP